MTQVRHFVDPEPVRTKLKNAPVAFFFQQRQSKRVPIKCNSLVVSMGRTFDRDVRATGELRAVKFGNHNVDLKLQSSTVKGWPEVFARHSSPSRVRPRHQ